MNQSIDKELVKSQIASINDEVTESKAKIAELKKFCKSNGPTIKEKIEANVEIKNLNKLIDSKKIDKAELKNSIVGIKKMTNDEVKATAPKKEKKVKEDVTIDGHYFEDGQSRLKSEVFKDEALKKSYQDIRKKERRQARAEAKKEAKAETKEAEKTDAPIQETEPKAE